MRIKLFRRVAAIGICFFCFASERGLLRGQATGDPSAKQQAQNQVGEFVQGQARSAQPGRYQTMADMRRALLTSDAVFAAYCRTALLSPPRGFQLIHGVTADARSTPRGWPIPVDSGFIMVAYDSNKRLPNGRFASEGEGPVLGGFSINTLDCGNPSAERDLGSDEKSVFYLLPKQTDTVHGWPQFGGTVFMTRRTQPRWAPVTVERILKVQTARAQKELDDITAASPETAYAKWQSGRDERLRGYQQAHDQMAAVNKQQADQMLAQMLETEKQTEKTMAAMAQPGSELGKMTRGYRKGVEDPP